ncbi:LuxR C-terminal-related transcriptional regulator [Bacteroidota bacterium]
MQSGLNGHGSDIKDSMLVQLIEIIQKLFDSTEENPDFPDVNLPALIRKHHLFLNNFLLKLNIFLFINRLTVDEKITTVWSTGNLPEELPGLPKIEECVQEQKLFFDDPSNTQNVYIKLYKEENTGNCIYFLGQVYSHNTNGNPYEYLSVFWDVSEILQNVNGSIVKPHREKSDQNSLFSTLTKRECEIIHLLATGLTSKEISKLLNISAYTVDTHRKNLKEKLSAKNTADLIRYAASMGLT